MNCTKSITGILLALTVTVNANVITDQLVAHFPFNNNALDSTGNGHDGSVIGANLTLDRFGNPNSAYNFNGFSDYINCGNIINGFSSFTVSAWINIDRITNRNYMGPWSQTTLSTVTASYAMYTGSAGNSFGSSMRWPDNQYINTRVSHSIPEGEWHLITQTYDGNTIYQYDNDTLVNSTVAGENELNNLWDFNIGRTVAYPFNNAQTYYFDGQIDDVRIYDRAITAQEVNSLYAAVPEPSTAILLSVSGLLIFSFRKKRFR